MSQVKGAATPGVCRFYTGPNMGPVVFGYGDSVEITVGPSGEAENIRIDHGLWGAPATADRLTDAIRAGFVTAGFADPPAALLTAIRVTLARFVKPFREKPPGRAGKTLGMTDAEAAWANVPAGFRGSPSLAAAVAEMVAQIGHLGRQGRHDRDELGKVHGQLGAQPAWRGRAERAEADLRLSEAMLEKQGELVRTLNAEVIRLAKAAERASKPGFHTIIEAMRKRKAAALTQGDTDTAAKLVALIIIARQVLLGPGMSPSPAAELAAEIEEIPF